MIDWTQPPDRMIRTAGDLNPESPQQQRAVRLCDACGGVAVTGARPPLHTSSPFDPLAALSSLQYGP